MSKKLQGNLMLLFTALIWGTAFVAQSTGMDHVEPFTYNGIRIFIGGLALIPVILLFDKLKPAEQRPSREERRKLDRSSAIGGLFCGCVLFLASSFQQFGISMTTAGKAGFITALYVVIVPFLGVFIKKKIPKITWVCVAIAVFGFYLLCVNEGFSISKGDLLVLCCAFFYSMHIMVIDHFTAKNVDGIRMSCVQFLVAGVLGMIMMFLTETPVLANIWAARMSILYTGVVSSGVGYTLQILGQKHTEPTTATLLMSLESVFAALAGWLLLNEVMTGKEFLGCVLVFAAVILAQVPLPMGKKANK